MKDEQQAIYIRAHIVPATKAVPEKQPPAKSKDHPKCAKWALIFDNETRIDLGQALTFGVWRLCKLVGNCYVLIEEGIFYADDLPAHELEVLNNYVQSHPSDAPCFTPRFTLLSCSEFILRVFYRWAKEGALICGFNLPFDLSRFACAWPEGHKDEWSLLLSRYAGSGKENVHNPRVTIEPLDSKKAFIRFWREWKCSDPSKINDSRFLDLRTLLWALYNKPYSVKSACDNEKGPFKGQNLPQKLEDGATGKVTFQEIDYARQDVRCTAALLNAAKQEFDLHPIPLDPDQAYSPASIAKSYLEAIGIKKPAKKFDVPNGILNVAMESFSGGRAETKIRLCEVPVVPVDLTSEYPSVCVLLGLFDILTAEHLEFPDATSEAQKLLDEITLDDCFNRNRWKEFGFFARIKPDACLLPVRKMYNGITENVGNNFLSANPENPQEQWVAGLDLIAAKIRTGKVPHILEAFRVVPVGKQKGMKPIKLRGMIEINPYTDDLFKRVIELRKQNSSNAELAYWLKIFANSMYGFFAEVNPEEVRPLRVRVYKGKDASYPHDPERKPGYKTVTIEKQGTWYAPYLASLITSGGRLLLAMIEESVTRANGTYLYGDTDALGIVASEHGGSLDHVPGCAEKHVRALKWTEVDEIVSRFDDVNPYDPTAVPHLLSLTGDNWTDKTKTKRRHLLGMSISAKRYALYERQGSNITIVNAKAHGLGYLLPPVASPKGWEDDHEIPKWIFDTWEWIVRKVLKLLQIDLPWLKYPCMMREVVTTCNLLRNLHQWENFRPFNFFMRPILRKHNCGDGESMLSLVCPFEKDSSRWSHAICFNTADPSDKNEYNITTNLRDTIVNPWQHIWVKDFETLLSDYICHPESKSLGPDGQRCTGRTVGLLERDHVIAGEIIRIGKEGPRGLEEGDEPTEVMEFESQEYTEPKKTKKHPDMVQPTIGHVQQLRKIGYRKLIQTGCSRKFLNKIRSRSFVREVALRDFERAVRECKSRGSQKWYASHKAPIGSVR